MQHRAPVEGWCLLPSPLSNPQINPCPRLPMKSSLLPLAALILSLGASAPLRAADPAPADKAAPAASLADPSKLTSNAKHEA